MKLILKTLPIVLLSVLTLSSCLTTKKMDKFIASEYNDHLPKLSKKQKADITVTLANPSTITGISSTLRPINKTLPLIVYWEFYRKQTSTLNNAIALTSFTNAINSAASKALDQKLAGDKKLELTIEKVPSAFSLINKDHVIWVVYAFSWSKVYMEPDVTNLVVSYKLTGTETKTGTITVKNPLSNQNIRFLQSWKSAASEQIASYNAALVSMSKDFVNQLVQEL